MNICIVHPKVAKESAEKLAEELNADCVNPFEQDRRDFTNYDLVFNYGCSRNLDTNLLINSKKGVARCVDKINTLYHLSRTNIPCISYSKSKEDIPSSWEIIVVRKDSSGNNSNSIEYVNQGDSVPDAQLYTEYYDHEFELRVIVFKGKVIARYHKKRRSNNTWKFTKVEPTGFEDIDSACLHAAEVLKIDFVGFDILARNEKEFKIIEANSAPMITNTIINAIKEELV